MIQSLLLIMISDVSTNSRVNHLFVISCMMRQSEGGVSPTESIEYSTRDTLDIAGDRVSDELDSSDEETTSKKQPGC